MIVLQRRIGALALGALLAVGAGLGGFACGSPEPKAPAAARPRPLHLSFVSGLDTNGGTALHVLVRKTNKTDYPRQDYDDVAKSLLLESDPNTLEWLVVTPGNTHEVVVPRPADSQVGVYFLFSAPGARWRHLVDDDSIESVQFEVGRDQIKELPVPAAQAASARGGSRKTGR